MFKPLDALLRYLVMSGRLGVVDAAGGRSQYGDGTGRAIEIALADRATERRLALDPNLALGECYMEGRLTLSAGGIYDLVELLMINANRRGLPMWTHGFDLARLGLRRIAQYNPAGRARRNVHCHYDIDPRIYDLFLDTDKQYSCAYFTPGADLEEAQLAKKRHIAAKLALSPGCRVLDIGCGWGGLGLYLAETGAVVRGITLSQEQLRIAEARARDIGAQRVRFDLADYRDVDERYDRVVSVGMFEHVGVNHFGTYFRRIARLIDGNGIALIHSIGRTDGPGFTNPFIAKHIFPGGYFPALSEVLPEVERAGLLVTDVEILRLHYAETLKAWRERFVARWEEAVAIAGEPFARKWEFYLAGSEAAFRHQGLVVFQLQLAKRVDALPITRDYIAAAERRLALREQAEAEPPRMAVE